MQRLEVEAQLASLGIDHGQEGMGEDEVGSQGIKLF